MIFFSRYSGLHGVLKCVVSSSSESFFRACVGSLESSKKCASRPKLSTDFEQGPGDTKNHRPSRCIRVSLWLDVINSQKNRNTYSRASGQYVGTSGSSPQDLLGEGLLQWIPQAMLIANSVGLCLNWTTQSCYNHL